MTEVLSVNFKLNFTDIELIFDADCLKKFTNVSVTIFIEIKKLPVWSIGILKEKGQSSCVRLHILGSCFKNLAFPCPQGTILIELKDSKRPKRIHACIYSSAYSYLLSLIGQPSCNNTLRTLTDTRTCRFDMALSCSSDHSGEVVTGSLNLVPGLYLLALMKLDTRLTIPIASQPGRRLCFKMILHSLTWHGPRGRVK